MVAKTHIYKAFHMYKSVVNIDFQFNIYSFIDVLYLTGTIDTIRAWGFLSHSGRTGGAVAQPVAKFAHTWGSIPGPQDAAAVRVLIPSPAVDTPTGWVGHPQDLRQTAWTLRVHSVPDGTGQWEDILVGPCPTVSFLSDDEQFSWKRENSKGSELAYQFFVSTSGFTLSFFCWPVDLLYVCVSHILKQYWC